MSTICPFLEPSFCITFFYAREIKVTQATYKSWGWALAYHKKFLSTYNDLGVIKQKNYFEHRRIIIALVHGNVTLTISKAILLNLEMEHTLSPSMIMTHSLRRMQSKIESFYNWINYMFADTSIVSSICFTIPPPYWCLIVEFGVCRKTIAAMSPSSLMIHLPYANSSSLCREMWRSRGQLMTNLLP